MRGCREGKTRAWRFGYIDQRSWTFSGKKWEALRVLTEVTHLDLRFRKISLGGKSVEAVGEEVLGD